MAHMARTLGAGESNLEELDAEALRRLPRCSICGTEAMAWKPGRRPEYSDAPLLIVLDRGERAEAWCAKHFRASWRRAERVL